MKIRAHETFFIRKGWINKGIKNVSRNPEVFIDKEKKPSDILGIGNNMVKSLRYWLQAVGLSEEPKSGKRIQKLTNLGELIRENDPYIEEYGTLCLLQFELAKNEELATSWYFFFNRFNMKEFTKNDFTQSISNYLKMQNIDVAERSLDDDFNCIINTYISRSLMNPDKQQPESNIDCPLGELELVAIANKKEKTYRKVIPNISMIPNEIAMAIINENSKGQNEIQISEIYSGECNLGKVFNLDMIALMNLLHALENDGFLKVVRTAGLDVVRIKKNDDFYALVKSYYQGLQ